MGDPEQSSHIIRSLGNRNVCPECADVFLAVLDAVRAQRTATDGATELAEGLAPKPCAGAPDPVRSGPPQHGASSSTGEAADLDPTWSR